MRLDAERSRQSPATGGAPGSPLEVFWAFLRLGLGSFGGPIAHLGYFRDAFVLRRHWLDEQSYADLVGLCQFLPGPASSQVGFSIGLMRAGYLGGLAAWAAFTLPSAILLVLFAFGARGLTGPIGLGLLHGLQLVAVAIVAQAVWGMARSLCPDRRRAGIAVTAALIVLCSSAPIAQITAILLGAVLGSFLCRAASVAATGSHLRVPVSTRAALVALTLFVVLLVAPPLMRGIAPSRGMALFDAFYRSGALVFGGGHVVLPLLRQAVVTPGWMTDDVFLAGYGAAQAVPGPLFSVAAYLGAIVHTTPHGIPGAALALVSLFLPGILLLLAALPFWESLRQRAAVRALMAGVNAAVVGLLAAALYTPLWTHSVGTLADFALALGGFVLLVIWRTPPLAVVLLTALGAIAAAAWGTPTLAAVGHHDAVGGLHLFHDEVGMGGLYAAHRGDAVAQEAAVALHVRHPHLEQVVEAPGHHMALHDLIVREHHLLEALEGIRRGAVQRDLHVGEQSQPQAPGIQAREIALDVPGCLQATHALERGGHREVHLAGQLRDRRAPVLLQAGQESPVDAVQRAWRTGTGRRRGGGLGGHGSRFNY